MSEEKKKALQELSDIGQKFEKAYKQRETENDVWWESLTEQEREDAFYAVCKRIHKGDVIDKGSYRYVLYNTFGFDEGIYVDGMNCGYMNIHNAIFGGEELQRMKKVNRFEVIDNDGRKYVKHGVTGVEFSLQDEDETLKVFIKYEPEEEISID